MRTRVVVMSCLLAALLSQAAMGAYFINPPETNANPGEFRSDFPYQRNAMIDFATDPHGWAADPVNGSAYDLQPATNYDLEGAEDLNIYESDWLKIEGDFAWLPADIFAGSGRTGLLLFDNRAGTSTLQATLTWHLDNVNEKNNKKNVWSELVWLQGTQSSALEISLIPEPGYRVTDLHIAVPPTLMPDNWLVADGFGRIEPNPTWEEAVLTIDVAPGDIFVIDSWHTATECIPEPATGALFLCGLAALAVRRRKRT